MYILYKDDSIIDVPNKQGLDTAVADLKKGNLEITVEVTLEDFLLVNIYRR